MQRNIFKSNLERKAVAAFPGPRSPTPSAMHLDCWDKSGWITYPHPGVDGSKTRERASAHSDHEVPIISPPLRPLPSSHLQATIPTRSILKVSTDGGRGNGRKASFHEDTIVNGGRAKSRKVSFHEKTVFDKNFKSGDRSKYMLTGLYTERFVIPAFPPKAPSPIPVYKVLRNRVVPRVEPEVPVIPEDEVPQSNLPSNTALLIGSSVCILWSIVGWWKNVMF